MGNAPLFACLLCCLLMSFGGAQDIPTRSCGYVVEGKTLVCRCLERCTNGEEATLTWPGHSDTDLLEKHNVSRQQHGQNFTCRKVCGNETTDVNYTLQVAYGPDAASSNITGPSPFITNGTLSMTLTCEATVNPTPIYTWTGVNCDNKNAERTCTYTPSITEDGKLVKCKLLNAENTQAEPVTVEFAMSLSYPPPTAPNISEGSGSIVTAKDILTCTVTGGKPLVDSVIFTCTNPYRTQGRETTSTSVSSSLTIDTSQATTDNTTCYCSANWAPRPELYTMNSERNFLTEFVFAGVVLASTDTIIIIGVSVPAGSLSAVVIIVVVVRRRRKGKNASNDDHQTSQSPCNNYNNPTFAKNGADADTDSGVVMSASCHSLDGAGYAAVGDFPSSTQSDGVRRQTSSGSAAYEVTAIAMGRVSIKEAAPPQPNVYQEPWDAVKAQSMVAECFTGHGVIIATGPEGDKHSI